MEVLIIEDERLSAERLLHLVSKTDPAIRVVASLTSVETAVEWFRDHSPPDLVFLDIQLGDGTAFDLLDRISTQPAIIFTTAYDEYALKAFKFNSIEYLLKPVDQNELENALKKYRFTGTFKGVEQEFSEKIVPVKKIITGDFKRRFLIKIGEQYKNIEVSDVAYFAHQSGHCNVITREGANWPIDYSLDQLENLLHPMDFFRVNRQFIINSASINEIHTYFNSRLLLKLVPPYTSEIVVSRDRVNDFKRWMNC